MSRKELIKQLEQNQKEMERQVKMWRIVLWLSILTGIPVLIQLLHKYNFL